MLTIKSWEEHPDQPMRAVLPVIEALNLLPEGCDVLNLSVDFCGASELPRLRILLWSPAQVRKLAELVGAVDTEDYSIRLLENATCERYMHELYVPRLNAVYLTSSDSDDPFSER